MGMADIVIARTTMLIRPEAFLQAISAFAQATNSPEAVEAFRNSVAGHVAYRPEDAGHLIRVEIVVECGYDTGGSITLFIFQALSYSIVFSASDGAVIQMIRMSAHYATGKVFGRRTNKNE
jgi:hypothetical protein